MKNSDWICLPVYLFGFYPPNVVKNAKKIKSHDESLEDACKKICEIEGLENVGKFVNRWIPKDKFYILEFVQADPDNPNHSDMFFADEDFYMVKMHHNKLMKKLHEFLGEEPLYRKHPIHQPVTVVYHEEDEIEDDEQQ